MHLQEGDYATKGARNLAMVDEDSFWIAAFVEETKLAGIQVGAPAVAALMGYRSPVRGRVESIARSVNTPDTAPGALGLASVDPVFIWVPGAAHPGPHPDWPGAGHRPPRIGHDGHRDGRPRRGPVSPHGLLSRLFTQSPWELAAPSPSGRGLG